MKMRQNFQSDSKFVVSIHSMCPFVDKKCDQDKQVLGSNKSSSKDIADVVKYQKYLQYFLHHCERVQKASGLYVPHYVDA